MDREGVARQVAWFAERSCRGRSPLYGRLCAAMLRDPDLLDLVAATPTDQPVPNLLLGAVHFLLLGGTSHPLAAHYASCGGNRPARQAPAAFRSFCREHREALLSLMATRRVQTNEVGRCAYLLPAFNRVHSLAGGYPLGLVELGCSAGLLLQWDHYGYDYENLGARANLDSGVRIRSSFRSLPGFALDPPPTAGRVGIDLHPVPLEDAREARWLEALLWPDQPERLELMRAAVRESVRRPVTLLAGDLLECLPEALESLPADACRCVFHCHVFNQLSEEARGRFNVLMADLSRRRPIFEVSAEWIRTPQAELRLVTHHGGRRHDRLLAEVDHHGRWIDWRDQAATPDDAPERRLDCPVSPAPGGS